MAGITKAMPQCSGARTMRTAMLLIVVGLVGCGSEVGSTEAADGPTVAVMFQDDPLAGVQVSLYGPTGEAALARAVTRDDGKAYFTDLPSPQPTQYRIELQSLGDGGWMLDPSVVESFCDSQVIKPFHASPSQELALPNRAVRSLHPNRRR